MLAPGFDRRGGLAPSEAFDPADFLAALGSHAITIDIEPI